MLPVALPATETFANARVTGVYEMVSPISYVRTGAPVGTNFWKLPTTWPLPRVTLPVDEVAMNWPAPVVTLPDVNVRTPLTVVFTPPSDTPLELAIVKLLNVVEFEPPIVWPLVPLSVNVLVPALNVPLLLKLPLTVWLNDPAAERRARTHREVAVHVSAAAAVADAVPDIVKLPSVVRGEPGIVFVPLPLRLRCP